MRTEEEIRKAIDALMRDLAIANQNPVGDDWEVETMVINEMLDDLYDELDWLIGFEEAQHDPS